MKILVTGGTSKLGSRFIEYAKIIGFDVIGINLHSPFQNNKLDLRDQGKVNEFFQDMRPDYIVHCAALSNADACEIDKENCDKTNTSATKFLAKACSMVDGRMISLSSDYVFDGKNGPYSESDPTHPINEYGKAKLTGENMLSKWCLDSLSIRSCVLYDWNVRPRRENFLVWLIEKLRSNERVKIVDDQYATPTFIPQLAEVIIDLLQSDYRGVINVSGSEWLSRYEFSVKAADIFRLDRSLITRSDSCEFTQEALRPLKGGLKVDRIEKILGLKMYSCDEGLRICKRIKNGKLRGNEWPIKK